MDGGADSFSFFLPFPTSSDDLYDNNPVSRAIITKTGVRIGPIDVFYSLDFALLGYIN